MTLAKLAVGLPILLYPVALSFAHLTRKNLRRLVSRTGVAISRLLHPVVSRFPGRISPHLGPTAPPTSVPDCTYTDGEKMDHTSVSTPQHPDHVSQESTTALGQLTVSLPAAIFMGVSMVSRGEIGLLIAQLARGNNSSGERGLLGDEAFSVCIWAILVCTLVGPIGTGIVVRRWRSKVTPALWA